MIYIIIFLIITIGINMVLPNFRKNRLGKCINFIGGLFILGFIVICAFTLILFIIPILLAIGKKQWILHCLSSQAFRHFFYQFTKNSGSNFQSRSRSYNNFTDKSSNSMTKMEALKILNLSEDATEDQIKKAYKKAMMKNHPDQGGSTEMAQQINEAKTTLLGTK